MIKSEIEEIRSSQEEALITQFLTANNGPVNFEPLSVDDVAPAIDELEPPVPVQPFALNPCEENSIDSRPSVPSPALWISLVNMKGQYDFDVYFEPQKSFKGATWIYSSSNNKLFVLKDAACPINFMTTENVPSDTSIRIEAFFSQAQYSQDNVKRCINHTIEAANAGISNPDHLIRLENHYAIYNTSNTGHKSVAVPFQKPAVGQYFSTYILKFTCYSSCTGGLNRRQVALVFTLEKNGTVLGRRCMDLKICACPARDYRHEMKRSSNEVIKKHEIKPEVKVPETVERNIKSLSSHLAGIFKFIENFKECDEVKTEKGPYTLTVDTYEDFITLKKMYYTIKFHRAINEPNMQRHLKSLKKMKKQDSAEESEN